MNESRVAVGVLVGILIGVTFGLLLRFAAVADMKDAAIKQGVGHYDHTTGEFKFSNPNAGLSP